MYRRRADRKAKHGDTMIVARPKFIFTGRSAPQDQGGNDFIEIRDAIAGVLTNSPQIMAAKAATTRMKRKKTMSKTHNESLADKIGGNELHRFSIIAER